MSNSASDPNEFPTEPTLISENFPRMIDDLVELNEIVLSAPEKQGLNQPHLAELEAKARKLKDQYALQPDPEILTEIDALQQEYNAAMLDRAKHLDT